MSQKSLDYAPMWPVSRCQGFEKEENEKDRKRRLLYSTFCSSRSLYIVHYNTFTNTYTLLTHKDTSSHI